MAVGAIVARILTQYSDKGSKAARKDIEKLGDQFDDFSRRTVRAFGVAAAAVGAFAVKIGKDAVQAAIADQKSQTLLANSLRNTTGATNAAIASVEGYISKLQLQVGVADDQLRPALSKLAAVTGDVRIAQELLGTALDISAFSGADLGSATTALTRALQGNFRGLQKLVPSLDATTLKSKNFAKILAEVNQATQGAAASRAGTLEYRLQILRIRYSEILETLGYALLPVIEKFADTIQRDVLPQIERWINLNKAGLAKGFKEAAAAAVELLKGAIAFGQWVVANFESIKRLALLIASMWAVGKVLAFVSAIGKVTLAFRGMQAAAAGAAAASAAASGAAGAAGVAGGGALAARFALLGAGATTLGLAAVPLAAIGAAGFAVRKAGDRVRANRAATEKRLAGYQGAPGPSDLASLTTKTTISKTDDFMKDYEAFLKRLQAAQDKLNGKKKKELTTEQKIINAMLKKYGLTLMTSEIEAKATAAAIGINLERQKQIANSPTVSLAAQGDGSASGNVISGSSGNNLISIKLELPVGAEQEYIAKVDDGRRLLNRRGAGGGGQFVAQVK